MTDSFDKEAFDKQNRYRRYLRKIPKRELREKHDKAFAGTKYAVKFDDNYHRSIFERRLWLWFALRHYHFPKEHKAYQHFSERVDRELRPHHFDRVRKEEEARRHLKELDRFSKAGIKAMSINEVDRYLTGLNIFLPDATRAQRRKCLYEYFNEPSKNLPKRFKDTGREVRVHRHGRINNKYVLFDIILKHPDMTYNDFKDKYGAVMPTVTRESFNNQRAKLRKAGYDLPRLKPGPSRPVISGGKKARKDGD